MLIPPLQLLAASSQQSKAALSANAPAIGIYRFLFSWPILPPLPSSIRLRAIRAHAPLGQFAHHRTAVIALVGDHLVRSVRADLLRNFVVGIRDHRRDPLACYRHRLLNRRRVSN